MNSEYRIIGIREDGTKRIVYHTESRTDAISRLMYFNNKALIEYDNGIKCEFCSYDLQIYIPEGRKKK